MEVQAVQARCLLALGRRKKAQQLAYQVWAYVRAHGIATIDYPSRVFLCIADVLTRDKTAQVTEREVLDAGYTLLKQQAEMISDPAWKQSFLQDEGSKRALIARRSSLNLNAAERSPITLQT